MTAAKHSPWLVVLGSVAVATALAPSSFLSTVVGLMGQKGLIRDVTDPVKDDMPPGDAAARFESQNAFHEFIGQVVGSLPATAR
jgi:hypothetical protein